MPFLLSKINNKLKLKFKLHIYHEFRQLRSCLRLAVGCRGNTGSSRLRLAVGCRANTGSSRV